MQPVFALVLCVLFHCLAHWIRQANVSSGRGKMTNFSMGGNKNRPFIKGVMSPVALATARVSGRGNEIACRFVDMSSSRYVISSEARNLFDCLPL